MYSDISIWLSLVFVVGGLVALSWSSDLFVDGSAALAKKLGVSPFIIGMVIIGFGTCAPEFFVSLFSGVTGHANLSIGNAYGSCVFNVAGILGIAAIITPLVVKPTLVYIGSPLMTAVAVLSLFVLKDGVLTRGESLLLMAVFAIAMPAYCLYDQRGSGKGKAQSSCFEKSDETPMSAVRMIYALIVGLGAMIAASHFLVWGSVDMARAMGVGELVIGLTVVAIGTSVPELATAIAAARKGESELVLGNIVGSNLFNMLFVVGTAGALSPEPVKGFSTAAVVGRDIGTLIVISLSVFLFGINRKKPREAGAVTRPEGILWVIVFIVYLVFTVYQEVFRHG